MHRFNKQLKGINYDNLRTKIKNTQKRSVTYPGGPSRTAYGNGADRLKMGMRHLYAGHFTAYPPFCNSRRYYRLSSWSGR